MRGPAIIERTTSLGQNWTAAARRCGLAIEPSVRVANPRETFATAERLAHWYRDTISREPDAIRQALIDWRASYGVAFADEAIAAVVSHVSESIG